MEEAEAINYLKESLKATITHKEALNTILDSLNKEKEEKQYEKELRLKYERRYNSSTEENKKLKEKNKELENADLTTVHMNGFYEGEKKWKDKIKEKINYYDERGYIEIAGALEELLKE